MVFVRKAQLKDVEELIKFNLNYGFTKKDIFNSDGDYYVCINNDIICGCGTLVINEDFCIIKNIIVMEEYKRKKIGTMIVKTMLNAAEIKGSTIAICVGKCKGFSEYLGFKPVTVDNLPNNVKNYLASKNFKENVYCVSLVNYFKCNCKK